MKRAVAALTVCVLAMTPPVWADQVTIAPSKDNTLYQDVGGSLSNGRGPGMFAGNTASGSVRRGLVAFDVAAAVPSGATIDGVTLTMTMNKTVSISARTISLHRVLADWGEGTSNAGNVNDGGGTAATNGDATWVHRFSPSSSWAAAGGDFASVASVAVSVGTATGSNTWGSTSQMVADVQGWLDDPSSNFGWLIKGVETGIRTAMRFATREDPSPASRPMLTIDFTPDMTPTVPSAWGAIKALYR